MYSYKGKCIDIEKLLNVIYDIHSEIADDLCFMDIDKIFEAAELSVPDRKVGDKEAMKVNCSLFIDNMCAGGKWKSYQELLKENTELNNKLVELKMKYDEVWGLLK